MSQSNESATPPAWYCPSRWLLAHYDSQANIFTLSSHMCLADLNDDSENLLALVDFKQRHPSQTADLLNQQHQNQKPTSTNANLQHHQPPYECRLRVYRGQQLIYNHFLNDLPSSLIVTSVKTLVGSTINSTTQLNGIQQQQQQQLNKRNAPIADNTQPAAATHRALLSLSMNEDVYFYHKLLASHRISLEDHASVTKFFNKSEYEAWQMVRDNRVDVETLHELLVSLSSSNTYNNSNINGSSSRRQSVDGDAGDDDEENSTQQNKCCQPLSSHSMNFLALQSADERQNYLLAWKFKRLNKGIGEHLMSMDTICCAAARLNYNSNVTRSGDYACAARASTDNFFALNSSTSSSSLSSTSIGSIRAWNWNRILEIQREGLVLATEDGHLLIYELRSTRAILECNYRLPASPDHLLVERVSPSVLMSRTLGADKSKHQQVSMELLNEMSYKILISCRNCRIYCIDQTYLSPRVKRHKRKAGAAKSKHQQERTTINKVRELLVLKCNVVDMCWSGDNCQEQLNSPSSTGGVSPSAEPTFIVGCVDRTVYCFSSSNGECKWLVELELPLSSLTCFPAPAGKSDIQSLTGQQGNELNLVGVASEANRIDFYVSSSGRIVDSIYLSHQDSCQAMTFGRFGYEDNCLVVITKLGRMLIFILKRTANFSAAQCLSSAASYASNALMINTPTRGNPLWKSKSESDMKDDENNLITVAGQTSKTQKLMSESAKLPSAFSLSKLSALQEKDRQLAKTEINHNCEQQQQDGNTNNRSTLDALLAPDQLQVPLKGRDFVEEIVTQSRQSTALSRVWVKDMLKLKEKIRTAIRQDQASKLQVHGELAEEGNRILLTKIIGLGNRYRVSLNLRLRLKSFAERYLLLTKDEEEPPKNNEISTTTKNENVDAKTDQFTNNSSLRNQQQTNILVTLLVFVSNINKQQQHFQVKPIKFDHMLNQKYLTQKNWLIDKTFDLSLARLVPHGCDYTFIQQSALEEESVTLDVQVLVRFSGANQNQNPSLCGDKCGKLSEKTRYRPIFISSINVPLC